MKLKNNLVLLIILIVFAVLVFLFENPFQDRSRKAREDAGPLFSELRIDEVKKLQVKNADTTVTLINRDNDWFVVGEEEYPADPTLVKEALEKIQRIQRINLASKKKDKHTLFEVADGMATEVVLFGPKEKEIAHLYIGKSGPDLFSTYIRRAESDEVFLHEEHLKGQFDREVNNWRDKRIFDFDAGGDLAQVQHTGLGVERPADIRLDAQDYHRSVRTIGLHQDALGIPHGLVGRDEVDAHRRNASRGDGLGRIGRQHALALASDFPELQRLVRGVGDVEDDCALVLALDVPEVMSGLVTRDGHSGRDHS